MFDELSYLRKNIFKALPNCRLSSKTDSAAYNKASIHLSAFKVIYACSEIQIQEEIFLFYLVVSTEIFIGVLQATYRKQTMEKRSWIHINCLGSCSSNSFVGKRTAQFGEKALLQSSRYQLLESIEKYRKSFWVEAANKTAVSSIIHKKIFNYLTTFLVYFLQTWAFTRWQRRSRNVHRISEFNLVLFGGLRFLKSNFKVTLTKR